jgi:hypothetical protein
MCGAGALMSESTKTRGGGAGASQLSSAQPDAAGEIDCGRRTQLLDHRASAAQGCSRQLCRRHVVLVLFFVFQMRTTPIKLDAEVLEAASKLLQVRILIQR